MRALEERKGDSPAALQRNRWPITLMSMDTLQAGIAEPPYSTLPDAEIVRRIQDGDRALFEILMRRHNQRVYRAARAIVSDETEVEDAMQQAYINAFTHLHQFEARSLFSTWLTRIVVNEAIARRRRLRLAESRLETFDENRGDSMETMPSAQPSPEDQAYSQELLQVLEQAVDALPDSYRLVFVLRDVEGLSTSETSEGLGLGEEAVKTRLHRARAMLRRSISARLGAVSPSAFQFHATRCDRVVSAVLQMIAR
jgi:RNA polymerase sigma-70 factor (ECF subfamily)